MCEDLEASIERLLKGETAVKKHEGWSNTVLDERYMRAHRKMIGDFMPKLEE